MTFWQIMKREIWQFLTADKKMRIMFLFGAGISYLFLFWLLYSPGAIKNIPLVVYDQDQSRLSRSLIWDFECDSDFKFIGQASSQEEIQDLLREKKAYAALEVPKDFSKKAKTGDSSTALFIVNGANISITTVASGAASDILNDFSNSVAAKQAALSLGADEFLLKREISPVNSVYRVLGNPTQTYLLFFVIGLAMAAFQQGIYLTVGTALQYEYNECDFFRNEKIDPDKLLSAKFILYWILSMTAFIIILLLMKYAWGIIIKASALKILILSGSFVFAAISFCLLAASLFKTLSQFVRGSIMYTVPAFVLSGYTFPHEAMTGTPLTLSYIFPFTWFVNGLRELILSGTAVGFEKSVGIMLTMGIVCFIAAGFVFRRKIKAISES